MGGGRCEEKQRRSGSRSEPPALLTKHEERNTGATNYVSFSAAGCGGCGDPQSPGLADSLTTAAGPSGPAAPVGCIVVVLAEQ